MVSHLVAESNTTNPERTGRATLRFVGLKREHMILSMSLSNEWNSTRPQSKD
jgi:hypothetical protein